MERWNRESVIAACAELDAARLAEGNLLPLTSREIGSYDGDLEIPSVPTVARCVGSMNALHTALGRVTSDAARAWTNDQWTQNAQWARDVLASEGIDNVTGPYITRLSRIGLMPNLKIIEEVWDDVPTYRKQTGIETRDAYFEAKGWQKQQFIDNGKQYAEYLGREISFPIPPNQKDIYRGTAEGLTPSFRQITTMHGSLDEYHGDLGFVTTPVTREWTDQQWRENFEWLEATFEENGVEVSSRLEFFKIAGRLRIGPTRDAITERWGSLSNFATFLDRETDQNKRILSNEGVLRAAIGIVADTGQPISKEDLDKHPKLGTSMIKGRFGITKLNLRLGIISRTTGWDNDMLLWWGATSFIPAMGRMPNAQDLSEWSGANMGPSETKIFSSFDHSLGNYHEQLQAAQKWVVNQINGLARNSFAANGGLDRGVLRLAFTRNPELFHPDKDVDKAELEVFYRMQEAGVNSQFLGMLMHTGIDFKVPEAQLDALATELAKANMLNGSTLRKLEPYIIGLAPPELHMSWSDFIAAHRKS